MAFFANFTQFLTMLIITHKSVGIVATYTAYREVGCSVPASGKINMGPLKDFSNSPDKRIFPHRLNRNGSGDAWKETPNFPSSKLVWSSDLTISALRKIGLISPWNEIRNFRQEHLSAKRPFKSSFPRYRHHLIFPKGWANIRKNGIYLSWSNL